MVMQASPDSAKVEWLITRKGALVAGVGDEETLLHPSDPPDVQAKVRLSKDEAIAKLKDWFAGRTRASRRSRVGARSARTLTPAPLP